jgi:excisionase family DNA binding protein
VSPVRKIDGVLMYSVQDVADKLGVSTFSIERYVRAGRISAVKIGRETLISQDALHAFLKGQSTRATGRTG